MKKKNEEVKWHKTAIMLCVALIIVCCFLIFLTMRDTTTPVTDDNNDYSSVEEPTEVEDETGVNSILDLWSKYW